MFHLKQDAGFEQDNQKPQGATFHQKVSGLLGFVGPWCFDEATVYPTLGILGHAKRQPFESIWFSPSSRPFWWLPCFGPSLEGTFFYLQMFDQMWSWSLARTPAQWLRSVSCIWDFQNGGLGDGCRPGMTQTNKTSSFGGLGSGECCHQNGRSGRKSDLLGGLMKVGQTMNHQPTLVTSPQIIHSLWENLREDALCQSGEAW